MISEQWLRASAEDQRGYLHGIGWTFEMSDRAPADVATVTSCETAIGRRLPTEYRDLLHLSDGLTLRWNRRHDFSSALVIDIFPAYRLVGELVRFSQFVKTTTEGSGRPERLRFPPEPGGGPIADATDIPFALYDLNGASNGDWLVLDPSDHVVDGWQESMSAEPRVLAPSLAEFLALVFASTLQGRSPYFWMPQLLDDVR